MKKIEAQMVMAVRSAVNGNDKAWRSGNTSVRVEHDGIHGTPGYQRDVVVELHGNEIARFDSALSHQSCRGLRITDAGWQTATTKSRLNALLQCFCRRQLSVSEERAVVCSRCNGLVWQFLAALWLDGSLVLPAG